MGLKHDSEWNSTGGFQTPQSRAAVRQQDDTGSDTLKKAVDRLATSGAKLVHKQGS